MSSNAKNIIRLTVLGLLAIGTAALYFRFVSIPRVMLGSSRIAVAKSLGQPTSRLELIAARDSISTDCDRTRVAHALVFRRSFGRVVIVYFDNRDNVVCVENALSIIAK